MYWANVLQIELAPQPQVMIDGPAFIPSATFPGQSQGTRSKTVRKAWATTVGSRLGLRADADDPLARGVESKHLSFKIDARLFSCVKGACGAVHCTVVCCLKAFQPLGTAGGPL